MAGWLAGYIYLFYAATIYLFFQIDLSFSAPLSSHNFKMVKVYYYEESENPITTAHDSGRTVPLEKLQEIGVFYRYMKSGTEVDQLALEREYKNRDHVTLTKETDDLEAKLTTFFKEHLHEDEEIRYIVDGCGYFDVRDFNDEWIRILVEKNDMIIVPAGIYHRFTLTDSLYVKALRLFKDEPKWIALNRGVDSEGTFCRREYLALASAKGSVAAGGTNE